MEKKVTVIGTMGALYTANLLLLPIMCFMQVPDVGVLNATAALGLGMIRLTFGLALMVVVVGLFGVFTNSGSYFGRAGQSLILLWGGAKVTLKVTLGVFITAGIAYCAGYIV